MVRDYVVLSVLVNLGFLQIAASISGLQGLWLVPNQSAVRILGLALIVAGVSWYLLSPLWVEGPWAAGTVIDGTSEHRGYGTARMTELSGARNLNDIHGGMAGTAYAGYFFASAVMAYIATAFVGLVIMRFVGDATRRSNAADGLEALRSTDAFAGLVVSLRSLRAEGVEEFRTAFDRAPNWSLPSLVARLWRG